MDDPELQIDTGEEIGAARQVSSLWSWMLIAVAAVLTFTFSYNTYHEELTSSILASGQIRKSQEERDIRSLEAELRSVSIQDLESEWESIQKLISP